MGLCWTSALGLGRFSISGWPRYDQWMGLLCLLFLVFPWAKIEFVFLYSILHFGPILGVFPCLTCKTSEFTKTMEMVSSKPLSTLFSVNSILLLVV
jgi:hypothetical protein